MPGLNHGFRFFSKIFNVALLIDMTLIMQHAVKSLIKAIESSSRPVLVSGKKVLSFVYCIGRNGYEKLPPKKSY